MIEPLRERYDLVCLDVVDKTGSGEAIPNVRIADLANGERDAYREHFRGADAILHCAFIAAGGMGAASWRDNSDPKFLAEHGNIQMAYNVYKTAQEENVKRVVVTSSNHAADYFEQLIWADKLELVTPDMRLSYNFYGWAKASYELLGFVFASGEVNGKRLDVIQWRIGSPRDTDLDEVAPGDIKSLNRALGAYLSERDQVQQARAGCPTVDGPYVCLESGAEGFVCAVVIWTGVWLCAPGCVARWPAAGRGVAAPPSPA